MKELHLTIAIDKSAQTVFDFCLDPTNTPKWIDGFAEEQTNESPTKLGTIYRNRALEGDWAEYVITEYLPGRMFVMSQKDGNYHVRYTLTPLGIDQRELEYYEWVDDGELEEPFTLKSLQKLKEVVEQTNPNL